MKVSYLKKFLAITLIFVMQFQSVHASVAIGGGWWLDKPVVNGATTTWEAFKNGARSTVAISPSSAQVAKSLLRGGLVGLALSAVTQALLDGVGYVMDSAKQELRYIPKPVLKYSPTYYYSGAPGCSSLSTRITFETLEEGMSWGYYCINWYIDHHYMIQKILGSTYNSITYLNVYNTKETLTIIEQKISSQPKSIPLTTLATQIINLAEQGNPEAKAYITSVVQDMLEHDEEYRKSLEAQLDAKLKEATQTKKPNDDCPSGIYSDLGQCWVCDKSDHKVVTQRTQLAKKELSRLGKCVPEMENVELFKRINTFNEFIQARVNENSCWSPMDSKHIQQEQDGRNGVAKCKKYLR